MCSLAMIMINRAVDLMKKKHGNGKLQRKNTILIYSLMNKTL